MPAWLKRTSLDHTGDGEKGDEEGGDRRHYRNICESIGG